VRVEESPVGPVVRPSGPVGPVVLYLHGDRYLSCTPEAALGMGEELAARTGALVVCARYRCSFPAALEDVHAAYCFGESVGPVVLAGERLGAGLAASLLVRLRDAGAALPRCAVLVSGLLDLRMEASSLLLNAGVDPAFSVDELRRLAAGYAGGTVLTDPLLSPLRANLHGLPPIQLLAAGNDVLVDDSLAFAARAARSGVAVDLRVRPDEASLRAETVPAMSAFMATPPRTTQPA
jgi:epsilon-lactone hydrolase